MIAYFKKLPFLFTLISPFLLTSCARVFQDNDYSAYFGGEIINPNSKLVYLCRDNEVIDTIELDKNNRFFTKYDSLTPGMYTFKHDPEYQYIYFDKNDSLMIRLNTHEFDNSLTFCGRGDEKNNFLIELFLKNENDKNTTFDIYDYDLKKFEDKINADFKEKNAFYERRKEDINWDENFDIYAKSMLEMPYLAQKEVYPLAHKFRTSQDVCKKLPKDYYAFRKGIDFNNEKLTNFAPFVRYLTSMMNNVTCSKDGNNKSLENNIKKLDVADSIFTNPKIKNAVLNNIAFMYMLEDQNMMNNQKFLDKYFKLCTDKEKQKEIKKIAEATQTMSPGKPLQKVQLTNPKGEKVNLSLKKNAVIYFWTSEARSHMVSAHKRAKELKTKHPDWDFIAVNIDDTYETWRKTLEEYNLSENELHAADFKEIKDKWVITKIHRAMLINANGTINNGFVSLFDANFERYLK
ncbi:thioredoxin-like domain-containing protein [Flavobacterium sp. GCM10023249]|uniref:thioredoxin-like domain-containing protein n=1 Tax=unclassified Flavobacterium TaxID=196869 RepID=UPI003624480E